MMLCAKTAFQFRSWYKRSLLALGLKGNVQETTVL